MKELKIKKIKPNATIPTRGTSYSAGADLYACIEEKTTINPGERAIIPTGIAIGLEDSNSVALVFGRSGLGVKYGITLSNSVGVIDADYRGEIMVSLINNGEEPYTVELNERIAQLVVMPIFMPELIEVEELSETERGTGGFGSTGRK